VLDLPLILGSFNKPTLSANLKQSLAKEVLRAGAKMSSLSGKASF
jgi:hypothetical protein